MRDTTVSLILWNKREDESVFLEFESEAAARGFIEENAGDPGFYPGFSGWSIVDSDGRFIVEVGEDIIPLRR